MARLPILGSLVPKGDGRTIRPEPKRADPFYHSAGREVFRNAVLERAGFRCEWIEADGQRCARSAPQNRLFADHIKERQDGGDPTDPKNGMCLCGSHHTLKTARERARRLAANTEGGGG
jgi:5-methylcytosine-specific restriction enzyme A